VYVDSMVHVAFFFCDLFNDVVGPNCVGSSSNITT
jgi:hypothetical protein